MRLRGARIMPGRERPSGAKIWIKMRDDGKPEAWVGTGSLESIRILARLIAINAPPARAARC